MLRSLCLPLATLAATLAAGCHAAGCRENDLACAQLTEAGSSSGDASTSTGPVTTSTTTGTTAPDTSSSSTGDSSGGDAVCGDGVVEGGEACDDGNTDDLDACRNDCTAAFCGDGVVQPALEQCDDGDMDDTDSCVGDCELATCGDGFLRTGVEACDDGANNDDAAYGGCTTKCVAGPRCGDAKVNGPEDCDDKNDNEADGCLSTCVEARSCQHIKTLVPAATSGAYRIWPEALGGEVSVIVWCDMESDGGGYTFLKVDTEVNGDSDKGAKKAEAICQLYGMHLLATRTSAHTKSAYKIATTLNVQPVGGGQVAFGIDYLAILAIYPKMPGATCGGKALNSADCPDWLAWDSQPYWVTDVPVPGQPDTDQCAGCSMFYKWNLDGTLKSYTTVSFGEGASSYRFLCDIGDKHP